MWVRSTVSWSHDDFVSSLNRKMAYWNQHSSTTAIKNSHLVCLEIETLCTNHSRCLQHRDDGRTRCWPFALAQQQVVLDVDKEQLAATLPRSSHAFALPQEALASLWARCRNSPAAHKCWSKTTEKALQYHTELKHEFAWWAEIPTVQGEKTQSHNPDVFDPCACFGAMLRALFGLGVGPRKGHQTIFRAPVKLWELVDQWPPFSFTKWKNTSKCLDWFAQTDSIVGTHLTPGHC